MQLYIYHYLFIFIIFSGNPQKPDISVVVIFLNCFLVLFWCPQTSDFFVALNKGSHFNIDLNNNNFNNNKFAPDFYLRCKSYSIALIAESRTKSVLT